MMTETLPEIPLAEADAATAAIYRRLMRLTGVGSPALIYRHLATYPGLLEWTWAAVGGELESGRIQGAALAVVDGTRGVRLPAIGRDTLCAAGVDRDGRALVDAMLATYNRMNPINLSLIAAIRSLLAEPGPAAAATGEGSASSPATARPPAAVRDLPAPIGLQDMAPRLRETVLGLSAAIPNPGRQVIPTLYRHLAIWPGLLMAIASPLQHALDDGRIEAATDRLTAAMRPLIAEVSARARARMVAAAPVDESARLRRTLDAFLITIPQLVVVGRAIAEALPPVHGRNAPP